MDCPGAESATVERVGNDDEPLGNSAKEGNGLGQSRAEQRESVELSKKTLERKGEGYESKWRGGRRRVRR